MKIAPILVIGLLLVLLIAGCGQSGDLPADDNPTVSEEQQEIVEQEANDIIDPNEELDLGEMI